MTTVHRKKILVFAHVPPPHHGQSVMVQILLDGLRSDPGYEVYHIDSRVADGIGDLGSLRPSKLLRLLGYCFKAWRIRWRHGSMALYYVPAPDKRSAILRDWLVMALCRPFFPELILHWHAVGLGARRGLAAFLTRRALGGAALSIVLTEFNRADAQVFHPRRIEVVPNGVPDPCPDIHDGLREERLQRAAARSRGEPYRCLFLAHCTEAKGIFAALEAVALANKQAGGAPVTLTVAGEFIDPFEKELFDRRVLMPDLVAADGLPFVRRVGFLGSEAKDKAMRSHDCLVFPSHWESFGLSLIEAAAYGLPGVISDQPNLASLLPSHLRFVAPAGDVSRLAEAITTSMQFRAYEELRAAFLARYQAGVFVARMREVLL